ncbi:ABC transporter ATP-binding protein [Variovorax sp. PAMC 28711]|uniref:ABC transporter ATP-binding protein n=1 Tax=Variovorax sp. PAMC 28711 TaxID=1795631 RepID=UPI00078E7FC1|nr:ABC transporter ATP-binding protein [Variovorax sp. PAMC 28711]AMM26360.1 peptide ABC transporter ATP-binding protein [Variovorax sp. PAMC 28711]
MNANEPLLSVQGLNLVLDTPAGAKQILYDINLEVRAGETLCLVGESGSGKSMTGLALLGLAPAGARITARSIRFAGEEIAGLDGQRMRSLRGRRMAMIFQEPMSALNPLLTIGLQITESLRQHSIVTRAEERERAEALLHSVGIADPARRLDAYPHQLSGGMRQRAMIAIALAAEPQLLIADEPTTALDVTVQAQVLDLLKDLQQRLGTAMILITHDMGVVADVADRVNVMYAGRKVEDGPLRDVLSPRAHPYTRALVSCMPRQHAAPAGRRIPLPEIPGVVPSTAALPPGCAFAPRCPQAEPDCARGVPPMHRLQPDHTTACWRQHEGTL